MKIVMNTKTQGLGWEFGPTLRTRLKYCEHQQRARRRKTLAGNPQKFIEWLHHARATNLCKLPLETCQIHHMFSASVGCESNIFFTRFCLASGSEIKKQGRVTSPVIISFCFGAERFKKIKHGYR